MTVKTAADAGRYWMESKIFGQKRVPKGRQDFGDDATVGLCLRRIGVNLGEPSFDPDNAFGRYLGSHPDGWVVGICRLDSSDWSGCEVFDDLETLRTRWELD